MNKRKYQIGEMDKLKLKAVLLHDSSAKEVHMTQSVGFVVADLVSVG